MFIFLKESLLGVDAICHILKLVSELFESIGNITLLTHSKLPCGDGSISLGQSAICIARERKYEHIIYENSGFMSQD
jgi:hypothetical protein